MRRARKIRFGTPTYRTNGNLILSTAPLHVLQEAGQVDEAGEITAYGAALFAFTQTLNIEAARRHLGWSPKVNFADGLARTFA